MSKTASSSNKTICLCMIVKNEAHVIARALLSAKDWIDYWVICDTGSTDDTPRIVSESLAGIPGELHRTEWVNFGHNRMEALNLARGKSNYVLIMDADMVLNVSREFRHKLTADYYEIRYTGDVDYTQNMLVANRFEWQYYGVTHEYLHAENAQHWDFLPEVSLTHHADGGNRSEKFLRDIALLTEALKTEPDNPRSHFYLAQSYRDLEQWDEALFWYLKRAECHDAWEEERWYALFQAADMKRLLGHPWPEVLAAYHAAIDARPHRIEPVYAITRYYRESGAYMQGYLCSSFALQGIAYPDRDLLFIEKPVYAYLLLLEHAACALACGRITETILAVNLITAYPQVPKHVYAQAIQARSMALQLLYGNGNNPAKHIPKPAVVVIVPFHNAGKSLIRCAASLLAQNTMDFRVIFVDDASEDRPAGLELPDTLHATQIRNRRRHGALFNYYQAIMEYCDPDDIVVCLDGDDRLAQSDVISFIRDYYHRYDCWVMYGQYVESDGTPGLSAPFASPNDFLTLRSRWRTSHIRTFKAGLFHCIQEQDPELLCFKDPDGDWLTAATDAAMMFPLIEMAGFEKTHFNERVLYIYHKENPGSHHASGLHHQQQCYDSVRRMRPLARVDSYYPALHLQSMIN